MQISREKPEWLPRMRETAAEKAKEVREARRLQATTRPAKQEYRSRCSGVRLVGASVTRTARAAMRRVTEEEAAKDKLVAAEMAATAKAVARRKADAAKQSLALNPDSDALFRRAMLLQSPGSGSESAQQDSQMTERRSGP